MGKLGRVLVKLNWKFFLLNKVSTIELCLYKNKTNIESHLHQHIYIYISFIIKNDYYGANIINLNLIIS